RRTSAQGLALIFTLSSSAPRRFTSVAHAASASSSTSVSRLSRSDPATRAMLDKVTSTLAHAIEQLDHQDPDHKARRIVFTVLHFDDWVGDYQTEYIAQLDAHLAANPIAGADLVFCPASNLFDRRFVMRSATVVEI